MNDAVAMVGLGNAGAALAGRFPLSGYDVDPRRKTAVEDLEIAWSNSLESVLAEADIVLLSLPRPEISLDVVKSITNTHATVRLVVETSTISRIMTYRQLKGGRHG